MKKYIETMTEEEFLELVGQLDNAVDRFILGSMFYGVLVGNYESVANLKVSDVDLENGVINTPDGRVVTMNNNFKKITHDAIIQKVYVKNGINDLTNRDVDFSFNEDSEYVIKIKPTKSNNFGINPITKDGFKTRMKSINLYLGTSLTTAQIRTFGAYNTLLQEERVLTLTDAERLLSEKSLSIRKNNLVILLRQIKESYGE